jgi:hypothetical protein
MSVKKSAFTRLSFWQFYPWSTWLNSDGKFESISFLCKLSWSMPNAKIVRTDNSYRSYERLLKETYKTFILTNSHNGHIKKQIDFATLDK